MLGLCSRYQTSFWDCLDDRVGNRPRGGPLRRVWLGRAVGQELEGTPVVAGPGSPRPAPLRNRLDLGIGPDEVVDQTPQRSDVICRTGDRIVWFGTS